MLAGELWSDKRPGVAGEGNLVIPERHGPVTIATNSGGPRFPAALCWIATIA